MKREASIERMVNELDAEVHRENELLKEAQVSSVLRGRWLISANFRQDTIKEITASAAAMGCKHATSKP